VSRGGHAGIGGPPSPAAFVEAPLTRVLGVTLFVVLTHLGTFAQPLPPTPQFKASMDLAAALTSRDIPKVLEALADNAVLFPPGTELVSGRRDIEKAVKELLAGSTLELSLVSIGSTGSESLGFDAGLYELVIKPKQGAARKSRGKYLAVLNRDAEGRWRLTHLSWNGAEAIATGK